MRERTWSVGAGRWVTYTEDYGFFKDMLTLPDVRKRAVYMRGRTLRPFAWDVIYPASARGKVSKAVKHFRKGNFLAVESNPRLEPVGVR